MLPTKRERKPGAKVDVFRGSIIVFSQLAGDRRVVQMKC